MSNVDEIVRAVMFEAKRRREMAAALTDENIKSYNTKQADLLYEAASMILSAKRLEELA